MNQQTKDEQLRLTRSPRCGAGGAFHPFRRGVGRFGPGLSGAALKYLALFCMLLDHVAVYLPGMAFLPLRWVGRLAAPIFFFLVAEGFWHTRNRTRYLMRLYLAGMVTSLLFSGASSLAPRADAALDLNILQSLFWVVALGWAVVTVGEALAAGRWKAAGAVALAAAGLLAALCALAAVPALRAAWCWEGEPSLLAAAVRAALPSPLFVEGGPVFLLFGVGLILCRGERRAVAAVVLLFSVLFLPLRNFDFLGNYQWMMVFALPLLLSYSGARGRQPKWFFYAFYPAHLLLLYLLPQIIG